MLISPIAPKLAGATLAWLGIVGSLIAADPSLGFLLGH